MIHANDSRLPARDFITFSVKSSSTIVRVDGNISLDCRNALEMWNVAKHVLVHPRRRRRPQWKENTLFLTSPRFKSIRWLRQRLFVLQIIAEKEKRVSAGPPRDSFFPHSLLGYTGMRWRKLGYFCSECVSSLMCVFEEELYLFNSYLFLISIARLLPTWSSLC